MGAQDSKLTRLISDALGGNCHTSMLITVPPFASPATARLLEIAAALRSLRTFPVVNDAMVRGLQAKYDSE
jgi:hypothetical protein